MTKAIRLVCPECGVTFSRGHHRQQFCTPAHKVAYGNRQLGRGQTPFQLAQVWRAARSRKDPESRAAAKEAFTLLCRMVDEANAEDRAAGRADPVRLFRQRAAANLIA